MFSKMICNSHFFPAALHCPPQPPTPLMPSPQMKFPSVGWPTKKVGPEKACYNKKKNTLHTPICLVEATTIILFPSTVTKSLLYAVDQ